MRVHRPAPIISGPPATLVIRGKPPDTPVTANAQRNANYTGTTLAAIVASVAARHDWKPACAIEAQIDRADQFGESDLHFITRLARQYGGTASVKVGRLIVAPRGGGKSADGKPLAPVGLRPSDLMRYRLTFPDRSSVGGERQAAVDTVVTALQAAIDKHLQLTDQLDALDRTHFSEMQRATAENTRLQHPLAAGDVRMSVRARC